MKHSDEMRKRLLAETNQPDLEYSVPSGMTIRKHFLSRILQLPHRGVNGNCDLSSLGVIRERGEPERVPVTCFSAPSWDRC